jgi:opacity protein-like surface antigen
MKKIVVMVFAAMLLVLAAGSAQAAFWVPTESGVIDVNYLTNTGNGTYAIFDDSSTLDTSDSHLELNSTADTIFFVPSGTDWQLWRDTDDNQVPDANTGFSLSASNTFQLAWMPLGAAAWYTDTSYAYLSPGVYQISWTNVGSSQSSSITQIDAVPSAVPVPPSVVMFFTGLLGLVSARRMRRDS